MKTLQLSVFSLILLLPGFGGDILLSPNGPIRTVIAARDAARSAPKPVRIIIAEGTYPITESLSLGPEDSPVTWHGKTQAFTVGQLHTGWTKKDGGLVKATISDHTMQI